jgi:predicted RNA-binding Zn ribbon-like protein
VTFVYLSGRRCLNFVGTMKQRNSAREELLTEPKLLSDWAVQGGLVDAAIDVTDDDLVAAIELPEAIYRTVTARLDGRRLQPADVDLLNERASGAQLTPRLLRTGATRRDGTPSRLLATLAADLLDLCWPEPTSTTSSAVCTPTAPACTSMHREPRSGTGAGRAPAAIRRKSKPSAPASAASG